MAYILRRNEDRKYVATPGSRQSYTRNIEKARRFPSRQAAESDACGNESVIDLTDILS